MPSAGQGSLAHGFTERTRAASFLLENGMTQFYIAALLGSSGESSCKSLPARMGKYLAWVNKTCRLMAVSTGGDT